MLHNARSAPEVVQTNFPLDISVPDLASRPSVPVEPEVDTNELISVRRPYFNNPTRSGRQRRLPRHLQDYEVEIA